MTKREDLQRMLKERFGKCICSGDFRLWSSDDRGEWFWLCSSNFGREICTWDFNGEFFRKENVEDRISIEDFERIWKLKAFE